MAKNNKIQNKISEITHHISSKDNVAVIIPADCKELGHLVANTAMDKSYKELADVLDEHPYLKNEGILTKAANLQYEMKQGMKEYSKEFHKFLDSIYLTTFIQETNHRYGKENLQAQELVSKMREVLRDL